MYNVANIEPFVWNDGAQKSFEELKDIMCSDLVLRLPRQGEPFQMYSDASAGAIGVVLCQIDPVDGKSHPCAYGSRKFNECELKLSIPCKELLAIVELVQAITMSFIVGFCNQLAHLLTIIGRCVAR